MPSDFGASLAPRGWKEQTLKREVSHGLYSVGCGTASSGLSGLVRHCKHKNMSKHKCNTIHTKNINMHFNCNDDE